MHSSRSSEFVEAVAAFMAEQFHCSPAVSREEYNQLLNPASNSASFGC